MPITNADRILFFAISILFLIIYYFYARTKEAPLFDVNMFKIKEFTIGIVGNIFSRLGGGAVPFLVPLMLQVGLGKSPFETGMIMLVMGVMIVFAKFFAPFLIKIMGYRMYLILSTVFLTIVTAVFFWIDKTTPDYWIYILIAFVGILNSLQFSGLTALTLIELPPEHLSGGNSLLSVVMQVAYSIGVGVGGFSLAMFAGILDISDKANYLPVFHYTYLLIAALTFVPVVFYCFLPRRVPIPKPI